MIAVKFSKSDLEWLHWALSEIATHPDIWGNGGELRTLKRLKKKIHLAIETG